MQQVDATPLPVFDWNPTKSKKGPNSIVDPTFQKIIAKKLWQTASGMVQKWAPPKFKKIKIKIFIFILL